MTLLEVSKYMLGITDMWNIMWNWLRNKQNLAVLTAISGVIAFVWKSEPTMPPPTVLPPQPSIINNNINIDNPPPVVPPPIVINNNNYLNQMPSVAPKSSSATHPYRPQIKSSQQIHSSKEQKIIQSSSVKQDMFDGNNENTSEGEQYPRWEKFKK